MTAMRGTDDAGRVAAPLDPENLRTLLEQAAVSVVLQPDGGSGGRSARADRAGVERWDVTVADATGASRRARVPNTDAAFDLLRSWVADDGWWEDAFGWDAVPG